LAERNDNNLKAQFHWYVSGKREAPCDELAWRLQFTTLRAIA
jgi:hypothetical protein